MSKSPRPKPIPFDSLDAAHRLWFLTLLYNDLKLARLAITEALALARQGHDDQSQDGLYSCFHDAAVVRYARGFLTCRLPGGKTTTKLPERFSFPHPPLSVMHAKVIAMRHSVVAHIDMRRKEVVLRKVKEVGEKDRWQIIPSGAHLPPSAMMFFLSICNIVIDNIVRETRPLIDERVATMKVGDVLDLRMVTGVFEENEPDDVDVWLPGEKDRRMPPT